MNVSFSFQNTPLKFTLTYRVSSEERKRKEKARSWNKEKEPETKRRKDKKGYKLQVASCE